MKRIYIIAACMICCLRLSAQTVYNTGFLQITLHRQLLASEGDSNGTCYLDSVANTVYVHAGAGYRSNTSVWNAVVGDWGVANGIGQMTTVNDSIYTICMDVTPTADNYFSNLATANADSGAMPVGANIYNIGLVFRAPDGFPQSAPGVFEEDPFLKGAGPDNNLEGYCSDIWVVGVNSDSMGYYTQPIQMWEQDRVNDVPIPAVTTQWVSDSACSVINGVQDISSQLPVGIKASPDPFTNMVSISFNMIPDVTKVQAQIYDVLGRQVADFSPGIKGGHYSFYWNGTDADGYVVPSGTYLLKVTNGSQIQTIKLIKI